MKDFDTKTFLAETIAMTGYQIPGMNYRRRRDSLPKKEQLRRIAKAQLKREQKAERKKEMIILEQVINALDISIELIMDEIPDNDTHLIKEFGMDELDLIEIIMILEDELNIDIEDFDLSEVTTSKNLAKDIFNQLIN